MHQNRQLEKHKKCRLIMATIGTLSLFLEGNQSIYNQTGHIYHKNQKVFKNKILESTRGDLWEFLIVCRKNLQNHKFSFTLEYKSRYSSLGPQVQWNCFQNLANFVIGLKKRKMFGFVDRILLEGVSRFLPQLAFTIGIFPSLQTSYSVTKKLCIVLNCYVN